jgi:hypothetical protein
MGTSKHAKMFNLWVQFCTSISIVFAVLSTLKVLTLDNRYKANLCK